MIEQDGKLGKIRPEDLLGNPDKDKEAGAGKQSALSKFIGKDKFIFAEANLSDEEKAQGVTLDSAHRSGNQQLIFDTATIDSAEMVALDEFIQLFANEDAGKEVLVGTKFEWFFGEENEAFLAELVKIVKSRQKELAEGKSQSSLRSLGFSEKLVTAMDSFREMTKRKQLKEGINKQVEKIPIVGFQAKLKGGGVVNLKFNPKDIMDPTNEVDVLFVNNEAGQKELIFSCKNPDKYEQIRPVLEAGANTNSKTYGIVDDSPRSVTDIDDETGKDYSRFEFEITKKPGQIEPLFTKIKVLNKPINLDEELDIYLENKEQEELAEALEAERRASAAGYGATRPSVPSSSQYRWQQQPQTYSRSG